MEGTAKQGFWRLYPLCRWDPRHYGTSAKATSQTTRKSAFHLFYICRSAGVLGCEPTRGRGLSALGSSQGRRWHYPCTIRCLCAGGLSFSSLTGYKRYIPNGYVPRRTRCHLNMRERQSGLTGQWTALWLLGCTCRPCQSMTRCRVQASNMAPHRAVMPSWHTRSWRASSAYHETPSERGHGAPANKMRGR